MTQASPGEPRKAPAEWMVFAALTLLSLAWLALLSRAPDLMADTARDLVFARDCSELSRCLTVGAKTSLDGFYQGGAWVQLIAVVDVLGGGIGALQGTVIALQALSCGLWFLFLSRHFAGLMPMLAALLWLGALCLLGDYSTLWNHSGVALPVVVASAGLLAFAATQSLLALWVAVFWTGLGMGFHMECAALLPVELACAVLVVRRPVPAQLSVLLAFLLGLLPTSLEAARANVLFVGRSRALVPVLAGACVVFLVARVTRKRFWNAGRLARIAWIAGGIVVPPALGLLWLGLRGHLVAMRYAYTALPAASALIALALDWTCSATARRAHYAPALLAGGAASAWLWWAGGDHAAEDLYQRRVWTSADVKAVAARLRAAGYSYEAARWHVQGPDAWELVTALGAYMPPPQAPPLSLDRPDLLVLRPPPGKHGAGTVLHPPGRPALYLRSIRAWLDIAGGRVCTRPDKAPPGTESHCSDVGQRLESLHDFSFRSRKYPRMYETATREPYVVQFVIPVRPVGRDAERFIRVVDRSRRCPWQIVGVDGIPYRGRLPARQIVLERGGAGSVSVARRVAADCRETQRFMRPCIAETHPDETRLRAALEAY